MEYISPVIFGILFSITILFTLGKNSIHIKDDLWFSKLGMYTYSLYLFHTIIILLMVKILNKLGVSNWYVLVVASLFTTVVFSVVSYHFFEKRILKLKKYFIS